MLDRESARYPWEMLALRQGSGEPVPLAVRLGVLRQLKLQRYREQVQSPRGNNALVIGEPALTGTPGFGPLQGARAEAQAVAEILGQNGMTPFRLTHASALEIMTALFDQEYRILHVAAHGVYDAKHPERSGVVLSDGVFLTAMEIAQLRVVPDVVFLNCCHLAEITSTDEEKQNRSTLLRNSNLLAASIAEQLISIGVHVVVAAGWAVNDAAAASFATQFYTGLLAEDDRSLGSVVQRVRKSIYEDRRFQGVNTWGAYQIYGDTGFTLYRSGDHVVSSPPVYVSRQEPLRELRLMRRRAASADATRIADDLYRVRTLHQHLPRRWLDGEMLYTLGALYADLGALDDAITCLTRALAQSEPDDDVPVRAVEQLAGLKARRAEELRQEMVRLQQGPTADGDDQARVEQAVEQMRAAWEALLIDAEKRLSWLDDLAATPMRKAIQGGAYKRWALGSGDDAERRRLLEKAAQSYNAAIRLEKEAGRVPDAYYVLNWVTCDWFGHAKGDRPKRGELLRALDAIVEQSLASEKATGRFFDDVAAPDAMLVRALITGEFAGDGKSPSQAENSIQRTYSKAFKRRGFRREKAAVVGQMAFLSELLSWRGETEAAAAVARIRDSLAPQTSN